MTSVIYFVIVRTTRKPTVDDPPKIAGRYTNSLGNHNFEALYSFGVSPNFL